MMRFRGALAWIALCGSIATSCAGSSGGADQEAERRTQVPAPTAETAATAPAVHDPTSLATPTAAPTATTPPMPEVLAGAPDGWPVIETTAIWTDGSSRPLLSWVAIDGADLYNVVVYDHEAAPYWMTLTSDTEVFVGGPVLLLEDRPGPRAPENGSWRVIALDVEGNPVASSVQLGW